jgi:hypothetical protein
MRATTGEVAWTEDDDEDEDEEDSWIGRFGVVRVVWGLEKHFFVGLCT